jgi:hypothetical protein
LLDQIPHRRLAARRPGGGCFFFTSPAPVVGPCLFPASPASPPGNQIVSGMPVRSCLALAGALPVLIPAAVLRSELSENKEIEHFRDSEKNGNALAR